MILKEKQPSNQSSKSRSGSLDYEKLKKIFEKFSPEILKISGREPDKRKNREKMYYENEKG